MKIVKGDVLYAPESWICHQCNGVTTYAGGVAKSIFNVFPWADCYKGRKKQDEMGTIIVRGGTIEHRGVINMIAQHYPGSPRFEDSRKDGVVARVAAFRNCLREMEGLEGTFAFPYGVGCGLAGGNWTVYQRLLEDFEAKIGDRRVTLYQYEK